MDFASSSLLPLTGGTWTFGLPADTVRVTWVVASLALSILVWGAGSTAMTWPLSALSSVFFLKVMLLLAEAQPHEFLLGGGLVAADDVAGHRDLVAGLLAATATAAEDHDECDDRAHGEHAHQSPERDLLAAALVALRLG